MADRRTGEVETEGQTLERQADIDAKRMVDRQIGANRENKSRQTLEDKQTNTMAGRHGMQ